MFSRPLAPFAPLTLALTIAAGCAPTPTLPLDDVPAVDTPDVSHDLPRPTDTRPQVCTPGAQVACACVGGAAGAQICSSDGTILGACACPDGGVVDAGVDAPTPVDAPADVGDVGDVGIEGGVDGGPTMDAPDAIAPADVSSAVDSPPDVPSDTSADSPSDTSTDVRPDAPADVCPIGPSLLADPNNCGVCGRVCPAAGSASPRCAAGVCTFACMRDYGDCDGNAANGCEANVYNDANCGVCGRRCNPANGIGHCARSPSSVAAYRCAVESCAPGYSDCDGDGFNGCEANRGTDPMNCGVCANPCSFPHSTPSCVAGACVLGACESGWGNCDGMASNGCETALTSPTNCGACGTRCGGFCLGGRCT